MKWWNTLREYLSNRDPEPQKLAASITLRYTDCGVEVVSTNLKEGDEHAMAEILFNLANGCYIDEIYHDLDNKIDEKRINEIMIYLRAMTTSQTGLEDLYEAPILNEQPFVSPCNVFAGMQNAEANNQL